MLALRVCEKFDKSFFKTIRYSLIDSSISFNLIIIL